ncbi:hypothetical protein JTE90_025693 [Oedothorax gibbosus]|uniref:Uncharacterized protein n=1 Tax=Oedothorax gibbosus TaxID=931172 RepID=A0AAV6TJV9_9ARAC|nr:hypothetical protein JTE90_025693 [Oedothorax gibbosus]
MTSTRYFFLFLCLAVLSSMARPQEGVLISKYLQLQATPLWVKWSPRDDIRDTVLRREQHHQRIYLYFKTEVPSVPPKPNKPVYEIFTKWSPPAAGRALPFCEKFGCQSSRSGRNLVCGSGFRFDGRSRTCRKLVDG